MDTDLKFVIEHITRLIWLHNLLGRLDTLTYNDVFYTQYRLRKRIKHIEDELGIRKEDFIQIPLVPVSMFDEKYLRIEE